VHIELFEKGFFITAGVLTLSFFVHNCVILIIKNNRHEENNVRDLGLGYLAVGTCYFFIGLLGFFGFSGNGFPQGAIEQNALDMFQATNPFAFVIRCVLFVQMTTVYSMVAYLIRSQLFTFFYNTDFPSRKVVVIFSLLITALTTIVAMVYPNVGSIVGYFGAICGLYFIYLTPVLMRMYLNRNKATMSIKDESGALMIADSESEMFASKPLPQPPSILSKVLHSLIPLLGLIIVIFQFVPPTVL